MRYRSSWNDNESKLGMLWQMEYWYLLVSIPTHRVKNDNLSYIFEEKFPLALAIHLQTLKVLYKHKNIVKFVHRGKKTIPTLFCIPKEMTLFGYIKTNVKSGNDITQRSKPKGLYIFSGINCRWSISSW